MTKLLAKSAKPGQVDRTILGHTLDVLDAVTALFGGSGEPTRLGRSWGRFFGLPVADFERFLRHLRVSASFHDVGKVNDGFQDDVRGDGPQVIRHEHLSALILSDSSIKEWLRNTGLDAEIILASVLSHHVKAGYQSFGKLLPGGRSIVRVPSDHEDFIAIWRLIQDVVGTSCPFPSQFPKSLDESEIQRRVEATRSVLQKEKARLRHEGDRRRMLLASRTGLIIADSVGSAVIRLDQPIRNWVTKSVRELITGQEVDEDVIKPRIKQLSSRGRWKQYEGINGFSGFQIGIAAQGPRVLLTTPCGSGKTLAAWNWIKAQADQNPVASVLFLYPTRATATEGFRDYVSWAPEADATLVSGTAEYDLQEMFTTPDDVRTGRNYRADPRLFSLGLWGRRYYAATADQFFPFLQYAYGPLCLLPILAEAVMVVDEVHSFDRSMYASLKRYLKEFPTPVLCMTATLPTERRSELINECGLKPYPNTPLADLKRIATSPRYLIQWIDREQVDSLVADSLKAQWRVLWVVNRVADCQETWKRHRKRSPDSPVFCYHSRFRLMDRRDRHNDLLRAFQDSAQDLNAPASVLGVTTQVCEMSLDLDADMLVTEIAPIASIIQRMGRCNRKWPNTPGRIGWQG